MPQRRLFSLIAAASLIMIATAPAVAIYTGNLKLLYEDKSDEPTFENVLSFAYAIAPKTTIDIETGWKNEVDPNFTALRTWQNFFKIGELIQWRIDREYKWDPALLVQATLLTLWQESIKLYALSYLYYQEDSCPYCRFYDMVDDWYAGLISEGQFYALVDQLRGYYGDGPWNYPGEYRPYYDEDESSLCEPPHYLEGGLRVSTDLINGYYYIPGTDVAIRVGSYIKDPDGIGTIADVPISRTTLYYNNGGFSQGNYIPIREGDNYARLISWKLERNVISGISASVTYIKDDGWKDLNSNKVGDDGWAIRTGLSYKTSYPWKIEGNYTIEKDPTFNAAVTPNDPLFSATGTWKQNYADQWALHRVGFKPMEDPTSAWHLTTGTERPVVVAVIDSGIDLTHPDLHIDNIWINEKERGGNRRDDDGNGYIDDLIGWNFVQNNNNPFDLAGHGTHVAGLIAARWNNGRGIAGINRGARIMPLKVLNEIGKGWGSDVARAVVYAVDNGAKVINISAEHQGQTKFLEKAFAYARDKGALVVVSAGNEASDTTKVEPANQPGTLVVAATLPNDKRVGFSNWGQRVNLAAPGVDVLSLRAHGTDLVRKVASDPSKNKPGESFVGKDDQYYRASGTSFAAPLVSGVASLMLAKNPNLTAEQMKRMLMMSADDIEAPGWDPLTGYGMLNARKALEADPNYYLYTELHRMGPAKEGNQVVLQAFGTVGGSHWGDYRIEIGEGENPAQWRRAGKTVGGQIKDGLLATLTPQDFGKPGRWTVRIVAQDAKGQSRESRLTITLQ